MSVPLWSLITQHWICSLLVFGAFLVGFFIAVILDMSAHLYEDTHGNG